MERDCSIINTFFAWNRHKTEGFLDFQSGEMLEEAQSRGTYLTVSDKEHSEIIRIYIEEGLGYAAIAERLHRSSRTPHEHISAHNKSVERSGFCASCKRARGQYFQVIADRRKEAGTHRGN